MSQMPPRVLAWAEGWPSVEKLIKEEIAQEVEKLAPRTNIDHVKAGYLMAQNAVLAILRGKE